MVASRAETTAGRRADSRVCPWAGTRGVQLVDWKACRWVEWKVCQWAALMALHWVEPRVSKLAAWRANQRAEHWVECWDCRSVDWRVFQ